MTETLSVSTGPDGLIRLTTSEPAGAGVTTRTTLALRPFEAAMLGSALIKHAVTALHVKADGKES